jgi:hypothetical protein
MDKIVPYKAQTDMESGRKDIKAYEELRRIKERLGEQYAFLLSIIPNPSYGYSFKFEERLRNTALEHKGIPVKLKTRDNEYDYHEANLILESGTAFSKAVNGLIFFQRKGIDSLANEEIPSLQNEFYIDLRVQTSRIKEGIFRKKQEGYDVRIQFHFNASSVDFSADSFVPPNPAIAVASDKKGNEIPSQGYTKADGPSREDSAIPQDEVIHIILTGVELLARIVL